MRPGQTSAVVFSSKIMVTAAGFLSTVYFARVVGASVLGAYFLLLSAMSVTGILFQAGIGQAVVKRMSENRYPTTYFFVGGTIIGAGFVLLAILVLLATPLAVNYFDHPLGAVFLVALLGSTSAIGLVRTGFQGSHNVHLVGVVNSVQAILRVSLQVIAVSLGFGLLGLVAGWVVATGIVAAIGLAYLINYFDVKSLPSRAEFRSKVRGLFEYSKYSWLGSIKSTTNNYADMLILGLFVSNSLVGIYAVCWNIASFLSIFGAAIGETLFPELSRLAESGEDVQIADLARQSVQFSGMFVIPGLIGAAIIGVDILRIYGSAFTQGGTVLVVLIVAVMIYEYQKQFTNLLNGMDRPDLAFRVNGTFIATNIGLNLLLVSQFGWIGAAVATAVSASVSLVYSYLLAGRLVDVELPTREVLYQLLASLVMGGMVLIIHDSGFLTRLVDTAILVVTLKVVFGVAVYSGLLLSLSETTRQTVIRNVGLRH